MYGCPKEAGISSILSNLYIVLVDPTTFNDIEVEIKPDDLKSSVDELIAKGFNLNQPSVLYTPGWKEHKDVSWMRRIKRKYSEQFEHGKRKTTYNLLIYIFPEDNSGTYKQVARKVPELGKALADFMNALKDYYNYKMTQVHLVGYSLSTHTVGMAGRLLGKSGNPVRQITALDPAGPCFFGSSDFAKEYTIRNDSANLVVTRHYGFGGLGARREVGGVDVFINGGLRQPKSIREMHRFRVLRKVQQDHRSTAYHEAHAILDGSCYYMAYECENYDTFLEGACANCNDETKCLHIGTLVRGDDRSPLPNYKPGTKMFLKTDGSDYCLHHYQLIVITSSRASPETISALHSGRVTVNFGGLSDEAAPRWMTTWDGSLAFTALVTSKRMLDLKFAIMYNQRERKYIETSEIRMLRLNYMSHPSKEHRQDRSISLCPIGPDLFAVNSCKSLYKTVASNR